MVIAVFNIKGGVGKTSAAVNVAALAAAGGARVLLWDLDPQGAASYLLRVKPRVKGGAQKLVRGDTDARARIKETDHERLDLLPADFSYRNMDLVLDAGKRPTRGLARVLKPLRDGYELIVLDCPPSISLASESVFDAADVLLVPLLPAPLAMRMFDQLIAFLAQDVANGPRILAFFSMVDGRKLLHTEVIAAARAANADILRAAIPAAADVERMGVERTVLAGFAPHGRAAGAYAALWAELSARLAL